MISLNGYREFFRKSAQNLTGYRPHLGAGISRINDAGKTENHAFKEYEAVLLATNAYQHQGLNKGEVGTIVEILAHPTPGYMVEFHNIPADNMDKVKILDPHEIDSVAQS